ncbi:MAG TPA: hypothetical protein VLK82_25505 [Candidatus Tectomicrobia bacterium]|nr:hypothetical protein [Candidatus Tectomicrobia bacterium]
MGWGTQAIAEDFEVWLVDQSNSPGVSYGGNVYIYEGADLMGERLAAASPTSVIDLAGATAELCASVTGANPVRPHMLFFNSDHSRAILSFVVSGHVVIFDAETQTPMACLRTTAGASGARQAHAAIPAPDDTYILVANQNGKLLERIDSDYVTDTYTLNAAATLNLADAVGAFAKCVTPNGVDCQLAGVRPDNAPICPIVDSSSTLGFVTLRGGGLFVVDPRQEPMEIVAEYDVNNVHPNGCGGIQAGGHMYINSGGGTAANVAEFDVYKFPLAGYSPANPPNIPEPEVVFSDDTGDRDSHGVVVTKHGRYLWVGDRTGNKVEVFSVASDERVNTVDLAGPDNADPSPDLMDIAPSGNRIFIVTRGLIPLSGDPHASTGSTPGMLVVQVEEGGKSGKVKGQVRISNLDENDMERADAHTLRVRLK